MLAGNSRILMGNYNQNLQKKALERPEVRRHFGWISITQVFLKWGKRLWQNKQPTHSDQWRFVSWSLAIPSDDQSFSELTDVVVRVFQEKTSTIKPNFWKCAIGKENSMVIPPCGNLLGEERSFFAVPTDLVQERIHWSCMVTRWWFQTCSGIFFTQLDMIQFD